MSSVRSSSPSQRLPNWKDARHEQRERGRPNRSDEHAETGREEGDREGRRGDRVDGQRARRPHRSDPSVVNWSESALNEASRYIARSIVDYFMSGGGNEQGKGHRSTRPDGDAEAGREEGDGQGRRGD